LVKGCHICEAETEMLCTVQMNIIPQKRQNDFSQIMQLNFKGWIEFRSRYFKSLLPAL